MKHVLPPASTTKVDLKEQAAGFFAQRRSGASVKGAAAPVPEAVREVYGDLPQPLPEPVPEPEPVSTGPERFTPAQLIERLHAQRSHKRAVIESGDPDGPEDVTGWDPGDVKTGPRGAALAAGMIAHQRRQQR